MSDTTGDWLSPEAKQARARWNEGYEAATNELVAPLKARVVELERLADEVGDAEVWVSVWSHGPMDVFATKDAAMAWNVVRPRGLTWDAVAETDLHGYVEGKRMVQVHRRTLTQDHPRNIAPPTPAPQGPDVEAIRRWFDVDGWANEPRVRGYIATLLAALSAEEEAHAEDRAKDEARVVRWMQRSQVAESSLATALEALERVREALNDIGHELLQVEQHCPCGARPESPLTHPHNIGCPVSRGLEIFATTTTTPTREADATAPQRDQP